MAGKNNEEELSLRFEKNLEEIQKELEKKRNDVIDAITNEENIKNFHGSRIPAKSITESIDNEREKIKNKALNQDITLKKYTLIALFIFLGVETTLVFIYSFFQAVHAWSFSLEEWSFKLLIAATITQITFMLNIAVKHLFPNKG